MHRDTRQIVYMVILIVAALALWPLTVDGQRSGGSRSSSSSSTSSTTRSAPAPTRSPTSAPSAQRPAPAQQTGGRSGSSQGGSNTSSAPSSRSANGTVPQQTQRAPQSQADKAMADKARQNGTYYQSRTQAQQDYRQKYGSSHPTTFDREPLTRPEYIPQTYSSLGANYTIVFNPMYHGYGYMNRGVWVSYDDILMQQQGYYVDDGIVATPVVVGRGYGFVGFLETIALILVVVVVGAIILRRI